MSRRRYLILYDIRDDKRLRAIFNTMRSHGSRFQYSVFLCDLSARELLSLRWELKGRMDESCDSIAVIDLGTPESATRGKMFEFLGVPPSFPPTAGAVIL